MPQFTVIDAPGFRADAAEDGTNSDVFVIVNFTRKLVIVGGTAYAGEMKKAIFSVLNYFLPTQDVLPMHCSANVGADGVTALFFGLSGTGKTTLSADPTRHLIGDDEHGWAPSGVFNFEGGCYAKCIRLRRETEPQIWDAIRFGTVLENVALDTELRLLDFDDTTFTENTRAAYPVTFIDNAILQGVGGHPKNIVFLTCDAFGVLPPLSRLTPDQAMFHFLNGYTAKVAGTERGLGKEPEATFSSCFGSPFLPRNPEVYAEMLGKKMREHNASCWLINTGWSGGPFGVGKRMSLPSRARWSPKRWADRWPTPITASTRSSKCKSPSPAPTWIPKPWTRAPRGQTRWPTIEPPRIWPPASARTSRSSRRPRPS